MTLEPFQNARMFVCAIVVDDKMQVQILRGFDIDDLQESDELLVPMPGHTIPDDLAVEHA